MRAMTAGCEAAEIVPRVTFHDLRRSYGSLMLNSGAPIETIPAPTVLSAKPVKIERIRTDIHEISPQPADAPPHHLGCPPHPSARSGTPHCSRPRDSATLHRSVCRVSTCRSCQVPPTLRLISSRVRSTAVMSVALSSGVSLATLIRSIACRSAVAKRSTRSAFDAPSRWWCEAFADDSLDRLLIRRSVGRGRFGGGVGHSSKSRRESAEDQAAWWFSRGEFRDSLSP
jgi:hypothetical protein